MTGNIKIAGVMGWPVEHSLSPRLHGYWLKQYGINGKYEPLLVEEKHLHEALKNLTKNGFVGVNLTLPHKNKAMLMVDEYEPLVKRVNAINTVVVKPDGKLLGRNTDVYGFTQNLRAAGFTRAERVTMLGAGGAARGVLVALLDMGFTDIRIANRTKANAEIIAGNTTLADGHHAHNRIRVFDWGNPKALKGAQLLVNATSLGQKGQPPLDIDLTNLPKEAWVADIVYAPLETNLLKQAKARGHKTADGLGMLLHQARPAFQAFFGRDPEVTPELRAHVLETISC